MPRHGCCYPIFEGYWHVHRMTRQITVEADDDAVKVFLRTHRRALSDKREQVSKVLVAGSIKPPADAIQPGQLIELC